MLLFHFDMLFWLLLLLFCLLRYFIFIFISIIAFSYATLMPDYFDIFISCRFSDIFISLMLIFLRFWLFSMMFRFFAFIIDYAAVIDLFHATDIAWCRHIIFDAWLFLLMPFLPLAFSIIFTRAIDTLFMPPFFFFFFSLIFLLLPRFHFPLMLFSCYHFHFFAADYFAFLIFLPPRYYAFFYSIWYYYYCWFHFRAFYASMLIIFHFLIFWLLFSFDFAADFLMPLFYFFIILFSLPLRWCFHYYWLIYFIFIIDYFMPLITFFFRFHYFPFHFFFLFSLMLLLHCFFSYFLFSFLHFFHISSDYCFTPPLFDYADADDDVFHVLRYFISPFAPHCLYLCRLLDIIWWCLRWYYWYCCCSDADILWWLFHAADYFRRWWYVLFYWYYAHAIYHYAFDIFAPFDGYFSIIIFHWCHAAAILPPPADYFADATPCWRCRFRRFLLYDDYCFAIIYSDYCFTPLFAIIISAAAAIISLIFSLPPFSLFRCFSSHAIILLIIISILSPSLFTVYWLPDIIYADACRFHFDAAVSSPPPLDAIDAFHDAMAILMMLILWLMFFMICYFMMFDFLYYYWWLLFFDDIFIISFIIFDADWFSPFSIIFISFRCFLHYYFHYLFRYFISFFSLSSFSLFHFFAMFHYRLFFSPLRYTLLLFYYFDFACLHFHYYFFISSPFHFLRLLRLFLRFDAIPFRHLIIADTPFRWCYYAIILSLLMPPLLLLFRYWCRFFDAFSYYWCYSLHYYYLPFSSIFFFSHYVFPLDIFPSIICFAFRWYVSLLFDYFFATICFRYACLIIFCFLLFRAIFCDDAAFIIHFLIIDWCFAADDDTPLLMLYFAAVAVYADFLRLLFWWYAFTIIFWWYARFWYFPAIIITPCLHFAAWLFRWCLLFHDADCLLMPFSLRFRHYAWYLLSLHLFFCHHFDIIAYYFRRLRRCAIISLPLIISLHATPPSIDAAADMHARSFIFPPRHIDYWFSLFHWYFFRRHILRYFRHALRFSDFSSRFHIITLILTIDALFAFAFDIAFSLLAAFFYHFTVAFFLSSDFSLIISCYFAADYAIFRLFSSPLSLMMLFICRHLLLIDTLSPIRHAAISPRFSDYFAGFIFLRCFRHFLLTWCLITTPISLISSLMIWCFRHFRFLFFFFFDFSLSMPPFSLRWFSRRYAYFRCHWLFPLIFRWCHYFSPLLMLFWYWFSRRFSYWCFDTIFWFSWYFSPWWHAFIIIFSADWLIIDYFLIDTPWLMLMLICHFIFHAIFAFLHYDDAIFAIFSAFLIYDFDTLFFDTYCLLSYYAFSLSLSLSHFFLMPCRLMLFMIIWCCFAIIADIIFDIIFHATDYFSSIIFAMLMMLLPLLFRFYFHADDFFFFAARHCLMFFMFDFSSLLRCLMLPLYYFAYYFPSFFADFFSPIFAVAAWLFRCRFSLFLFLLLRWCHYFHADTPLCRFLLRRRLFIHILMLFFADAFLLIFRYFWCYYALIRHTTLLITLDDADADADIFIFFDYPYLFSDYFPPIDAFFFFAAFRFPSSFTLSFRWLCSPLLYWCQFFHFRHLFLYFRWFHYLFSLMLIFAADAIIFFFSPTYYLRFSMMFSDAYYFLHTLLRVFRHFLLIFAAIIAIDIFDAAFPSSDIFAADAAFRLCLLYFRRHCFRLFSVMLFFSSMIMLICFTFADVFFFSLPSLISAFRRLRFLDAACWCW